MLEENFKKYVLETVGIHITDKVLLAVSGGMDSIVMAYLFSKTGFTIGIAHCNFNLRGKESDEDEAFVAKLAKKLKVDFFVTHFNTLSQAKEQGVSTQMVARALRYQWLEKIRAENGYSYLATAHHTNDVLETVLLNLVRGTGIAGLHGIRAKNGTLVRPLLFSQRDEIHKYVADNQIIWREDSSNASVKYQRNLIRQQVVPVLKQLNPSLEETTRQTVEKITMAENVVLQHLRHSYENIAEKKGERTWFRIEKICALPEPILFLWHILEPCGFHYHQAISCWQARYAEAGKQFISPAYEFSKDREHWILAPRNTSIDHEVIIQQNDTKATWKTGQLSIKKVPNTFFDKSGKKALKSANHVALIDSAKVHFPLTCRPWQPGDVFVPLGTKGSKKISDYLIDAKIPRIEKKDIWVVLSGKNIVWLVGHRIDGRVALTAATKEVLCMEYSALSNITDENHD